MKSVSIIWKAEIGKIETSGREIAKMLYFGERTLGYISKKYNLNEKLIIELCGVHRHSIVEEMNMIERCKAELGEIDYQLLKNYA